MNNTVIHIGFPKSGSSFIQNYFLNHPNVYYRQSAFKVYRKNGTITKEILPNGITDAQTLVLSEEQLSVWGGNIKINGKEFKDYGIREHQKKIANELHCIFPNAKILIVTRGFDTLIPSLYSQYISVGGVMSLKDFLNTEQSVFTSFYNYDYIMSLYIEVFGHENVLILPYELLKDNHTLFLKKIEDYCQIEHFDYSNKNVNMSISNEYVPVFIKLSKIVSLFLKIFPPKYQSFLYKNYGYILFRYKEKLSSKSKIRSLTNEELYKITLPLKGTTDKLIELEIFKPYSNHYII